MISASGDPKPLFLRLVPRAPAAARDPLPAPRELPLLARRERAAAAPLRLDGRHEVALPEREGPAERAPERRQHVVHLVGPEAHRNSTPISPSGQNSCGPPCPCSSMQVPSPSKPR